MRPLTRNHFLFRQTQEWANIAGLSIGSLLLLATAANPLAQIPNPVRAAMVMGVCGGGFGALMAKNRLDDINAEREGWLLAKAHQTAYYNHTRLQGWQAFQYHLGSIVEGAKEAITDTVEHVQERRELDRMETETGPKLLNWADLHNGDRFPHLALYGGTGDGKSHTANLLLRFLGQPATIVNPHHKPGDFPGFPVVGQGRDYAACVKFLQELHGLMDARYKQRAEGLDDFEAINIVLDEYNAIARTVPKAQKDDFQRVMADLISEARKVKIRLILLVQSDRVKQWGFESVGDLLDSCHWVYLRSMVAGAKPTKALQYWLGEGQYRAVLATPSGAIGADIEDLALYADRPAVPYKPTGGNDVRSQLEKLWASPTAPDIEVGETPSESDAIQLEILRFLDENSGGVKPRDISRLARKPVRSMSADSVREYLAKMVAYGSIYESDGLYFSS
jgi:hypothetical protein